MSHVTVSADIFTCDSVIILPLTVTEIPNNAFKGCTILTSKSIPNSVTKIGDSAFYGCTSLASLPNGIPSSVISIGAQAFYNCKPLSS